MQREGSIECQGGLGENWSILDGGLVRKGGGHGL
jgi:hypothetical protein